MATATNPVKILDVCRVTPSVNSSEFTTELSLPLTFYDIFWLKLYPNEQIFYYEQKDLSLSFFDSVIIPKLKSSLSLTLLHFLPFAGNIIWPADVTKPVIVYNPNDGVSLTIAESNADFTRLLSNQMNEAVESHFYVPELAISDSKVATIAIQITLFPNQGFSIGISCHHALVDGKSKAMFIKAWTHICKQSEIEKYVTLLPELTPCFDRTIVKDPDGLDMIYLNNWLETKLPCFDDNPRSLKQLPNMKSLSNLTRGVFELSRQDIKKLREKVLSQLDESNQMQSRFHLSTFVISLAYTIVCMVKARMLERKQKIAIGFSADCRARLDPPLPENYFGNCISARLSLAEVAPLLEENGITFVAERLTNMIKGLDNGVLEGAKEKLANFLKEIELGEVEMIGVHSSPKFEVYGTDFGWGRPKRVEFTTIDRTGSISMSESKDGTGGIEVGLVLKQHEMKLFKSLFVNGLLDREAPTLQN
ncbi:hypothetical protein JCGZ_19952 [Jatropha curcas]|uniref:Uncharacterized protein n=1 Tax=Jatropha curcas TaxID=180498 RepID=A0A067JWV5_JATCU|nr:hypothetical protein JCGZ_19952 [Jatropha curcas]